MFKLGNFFISFRRMIAAMLVMMLGFGYDLGWSSDIQGVRQNKNSYVTYCFYEPTRKLGPQEMIDKTAGYDIKLAKNEYEGCQLVIRSCYCSPSRKYSVSFSGFTDEAGHVLESQVYSEKYVTCISDKNYGSYPDALVPFQSPQTLTLGYAHNFPYYISVHADADTVPGTYTATAQVVCLDDQRTEFTATFTATVWDFTLPTAPSCKTAFGLGWNEIAKAFGTQNDPAKTEELYVKYYDYLLEHKISAYNLPVDILSDEADAYMSDPRVTSFIIPYSDDDATLQAYYAKVSSNPVWAAKGMFYPIDEPGSLEAYQKYDAITDRLAKLCPGYKMITPAGDGFKDGGTWYSSVERQQGRSSDICGISNSFDSSDYIAALANAKSKYGTTVWWYTCCTPHGKYCNCLINMEGIRPRLLFWQQKKLGISGMLYWDTTYWGDVTSPWADPMTTPWTNNLAFGDGSLFYDGFTVGVDGPISSLRLEAMSDGIDDYEYLTMAASLFGASYVNKKIAKVTNDLTDYTLDDTLLLKVRNEIGADIAAKLK